MKLEPCRAVHSVWCFLRAQALHAPFDSLSGEVMGPHPKEGKRVVRPNRPHAKKGLAAIQNQSFHGVAFRGEAGIDKREPKSGSVGKAHYKFGY